jgi:hypothetical protein
MPLPTSLKSFVLGSLYKHFRQTLSSEGSNFAPQIIQQFGKKR